jgi:oxygen-independent coproporphyrinogen-3 oxidase
MLQHISMKVRRTVKKVIEKSAHDEKIELITEAYVLKMKTRSPQGSMGGHHKHKKISVEDFYANTTPSPLLAGFKQKGGVHAGMSGTPLEGSKLSSVWGRISEEIDHSNERALYLHIPFCLSRCKFCSFYHSRTRESQIDLYVNDLMRELEFVSDYQFAKSAPFNAVYFGGGTPTDLSADSFSRILKHLHNNWNIANDCEITVEGRVHGFDDDKTIACLDNGVNRFSFGVQSFNTRIRRQMGRIETRQNILAKLADIAAHKHAAISIDLIYGFPDQTNDSWLDDIRTAAETPAIDSARIYKLQLMGGSPILEQIENGSLPPAASPEHQAELYTISSNYFRSVNARRIGVKHWAFSNRERNIYNAIPSCQNTYLPIGCGAGGSVGRYRIMQRMEIEDYSAKIAKDEKPVVLAMEKSPDSRLEGAISGALSYTLGLNLNVLSHQVDTPDLVNIFSPILEQWEAAGMLNFNKESGMIKLTDAGAYHCVSLT